MEPSQPYSHRHDREDGDGQAGQHGGDRSRDLRDVVRCAGDDIARARSFDHVTWQAQGGGDVVFAQPCDEGLHGAGEQSSTNPRERSRHECCEDEQHQGEGEVRGFDGTDGTDGTDRTDRTDGNDVDCCPDNQGEDHRSRRLAQEEDEHACKRSASPACHRPQMGEDAALRHGELGRRKLIDLHVVGHAPLSISSHPHL